MKQWCEFWDYAKYQHPCCLLSSEEEIEGDVQEYDCQNCAVADRLEELDQENLEAWRLWWALACRLTMDFPGIAGVVVEKAVAEKDAEDATDLVERLSIIYDTLHPPKQTS